MYREDQLQFKGSKIEAIAQHLWTLSKNGIFIVQWPQILQSQRMI